MRTKPNLCIALCGKTGCGKSEVANILIDRLGFKEYSFGEPIRKLVNLALPNIDYHLNPKARETIIKIAEEPKKIAPKCWAYCLTEKICTDAFPPFIVISDLRFKVELNHIKEVFANDDFGGGYDLKLVNIVSDYDRHLEEVRKALNDEDYAMYLNLENDASNIEHLSFYFDYVLENRESKSQLYANTIKMVETVMY